LAEPLPVRAGRGPHLTLVGFTASMDVGLALEAESSSAIDAALLPRNCAVLSAPDESPGAFGPRQPRTDFYVVGTAHVSAGSCDDVRRVVQLVHPDVRARTRACPSRPVTHPLAGAPRAVQAGRAATPDPQTLT